MPITDTDSLSTPDDAVAVLVVLTKLIRDVEALPEQAQERFWEDAGRSVNALPREEVRIDVPVSARSVRVIYNLIAGIFGQQLIDMVNGDNAKALEQMLDQLRQSADRATEWGTFLDEKFEVAKEAGNEGVIKTAGVYLNALTLGPGSISRVEGESNLLKMTCNDNDRYFASRDIVVMDLAHSRP